MKEVDTEGGIIGTLEREMQSKRETYANKGGSCKEGGGKD